ncbi:MAG: outer membrane protein transport protein [Roseiarcus sp.]|jgi:long-chain fatty acid transport protein
MAVSTRSVLLAAASAVALAALSVGVAHATDGYLLEGVSPADKATGGAGVAEGRDALTLGNNPAGLMDVGQQFNLDLTLFSPSRGYDATTTSSPPSFGAVAPGSHDSSYDLFGMPAMAYSRPIDADSSWGVAMYGAGGMNTDYKFTFPCPGPFCGGKTGVNLEQAFLAVGYAHRFGSISVGVAPILAVQMFKAYGLSPFEIYSSSPNNFTDRGVDTSVGGGLRAGAEWHATDTLRLGVSGTTPMWMSDFTKYSGLFAGGGSFNIPATIAAGLAYDVAPTITLLADYKHIFYSGVASVANSSLAQTMFGASNGPGFGWHDVDVISLGVEWRTTKNLTLRAGYSYNTDPIQPADVLLNVLVPGVITNHISAGASYAVNKNYSIDFAAVYAPENSVSGVGAGPYGTSNVNIHLSEFEATLGWTYKFDSMASAAPVTARY